MTIPIRREGKYHINGKLYPSVTTILQAIDKPALRIWMAKEAAKIILADPETFDTADKAIAELGRTKDKAADRGTDVHEIAARHAGHQATDKDHTSPYWLALESFFEMAKPEPIMVESVVYNDTHGYAGTVDLVAKLDGKVWLIDWKTSKAIYPEYKLQVAAYATAEYVYIDGTGVAMPKIDETAIVLLKPNGDFEFVRVHGDFEAFLAVKRVWTWMQESR